MYNEGEYFKCLKCGSTFTKVCPRCPCPHLHVTVYSRQLSSATREEPAEWEEWGECQDCGKQLDTSDIPEEAKVIVAGEVIHRSRQMPSEFYD